MKKTISILLFTVFMFGSLYAAENKWRLRSELVDGTTTYWMIQKKDSYEATRQSEYPTGTYTFSYNVAYSSATADAFWAVVDSTDNWHSARDINLY